ncbi:MAG: Csa1 family protein [Sarcina sp.]
MLMIGGFLIITQAIGCGGSNSDGTKKNPSEEEIVDKFNEFIDIFPSDDLSFLFDKEGHVSSVDGEYLSGSSDLHSGDRGNWNISSYLYTEKSTKGEGISINFDRNTRKAKGVFLIYGNEKEFEYPIYYEKGKIYLVDEKNTPEDVKEKIANFKILTEFIELDRKYLNTLERVDTMYNANAPIFTVDYNLKQNDKNINKIKEIYPDLEVDENNCKLEFHGRGTPWSMTGLLDIKIVLDKDRENYLFTGMSFGRSSVSSEEDADE